MDIEINRDDERQDERAETAQPEPQAEPQPEPQAEAQSEPMPGQDGEATVKEWAEALETAVRQRDEYLDLATRARADFDNYRKRNANIRAESYDDGNSECIKALLPVLDNFERAIGAATTTGDAQALLDGVKLVQKQLLEALAKRGLEVVRPLGEPFDPNEHNAVLRVSADEAEGEPGTICDVLQTGYRVKGKMLRHPMVKVIED